MENIVFDSDKFISLVQMHPALWDNRDADYVDKIKKDNGWRTVMNSMYGDEEIQTWDTQKHNEIGKELKKTWKIFRNSFAREVAKRKRNPSDLGRSCRTSAYYDQLSFLMPTMKLAEVPSNLDSIEDEECFERENANEGVSSVSQSGCCGRHKKKRKLDGADATLVEVLAKSLKWRKKDNSQEKDPDKLFLLSLFEDFKKISINKKAAVKIAIIKTIEAATRTIEHPHRNSYETITALKTLALNYSIETPVQNKSFHCATDNHNNPSPTISSPSQTSSYNVPHNPQHIPSQTHGRTRFYHDNHLPPHFLSIPPKSAADKPISP